MMYWCPRTSGSNSHSPPMGLGTQTRDVLTTSRISECKALQAYTATVQVAGAVRTTSSAVCTEVWALWSSPDLRESPGRARMATVCRNTYCPFSGLSSLAQTLERDHNRFSGSPYDEAGAQFTSCAPCRGGTLLNLKTHGFHRPPNTRGAAVAA